MDKETPISIKGAEQHYFEKRIIRIISLALALLLGVILALAFALDFESDKALFKNGSVLGGISFYGLLGSVAVILALTPIIVKREKPAEPCLPDSDKYTDYYTLDNAFVRIFRICASVAVVLQGIVRFIAELKNDSPIMNTINVLLLVFLALYLVPELANKIGFFGDKSHIVFGIISLPWFVIGVINTYKQIEFAFASSYLVLSQVGYILILLALVYEMRYHIDGTYVRTRLATSCAAFTYGAAFGLGRVVMLITVGQISVSDTSSAIICFVLSLYFGVRIFFYEED
jgi:hypothetical protein